MHYPGEKRAGRDRRLVDMGPPKGVNERRCGRDRRVMRIAEVKIAAEEWERHFAMGRTAS